jgi:GT2 family glycosyltransferase
MLEDIKLAGGYFDPRHFMYFEDMDLGWRARLAGWSAQYVPEAVVFHRWHGTVARHGDTWLVATAATNRFRTLAKNASLWFMLRSAGGTWKELRGLWNARGVAGMGEAAVAVTYALRVRREVTSKAAVGRRRIERRWVGNHSERQPRPD